MRVGFILVTHDNPWQMLNLAETLRVMFPDCAICCHHDFSQEPNLPISRFPDVYFVKNYVKTAWGHTTVIEAAIQAFRMLAHMGNPPDWYYLLSGADYPIKPAKRMLLDLAAASANVFIRYAPADKFNDVQWNQKTCQKYYSEGKSRFPSGWQCFAGEHWFTADAKAVSHLLDIYDSQPELIEHYRKLEDENGIIIPEESFYHTVFCNARGIRVENNCLRYIDWTGCDLHPRTLRQRDLQTMIDSNAHFARKLDLANDPELLQALFEMCTGGQKRAQDTIVRAAIAL